MGEILANSRPFPEHLADRCGHVRGARVELEILIDPGGQGDGRLQDRPAREKIRGGEIRVFLADAGKERD